MYSNVSYCLKLLQRGIQTQPRNPVRFIPQIVSHKFNSEITQTIKLIQMDLDKAKIELIDDLKSIDHPSLIAVMISRFISDAMKDNIINLYEGYLLNWVVIPNQRRSYIETAWNGSVRISICLALLNQRFLAQIFDNNEGATQLKLWGVEAMNLYKEKREHYIMDQFEEFLEAKDSPDLLKKLVDIRNEYSLLDFDNGPYHNEEFPYDYYAPEKILLEKDESCVKMTTHEIIEDLIVELSLI